MQYYAFQLDEESKELCVINTPFGKYKYKRLPMGVCQSSDIAQEIMEQVLKDIEGVEIYIDDIGIFSNSWEEHIETLHEVLERLQNNGFSINPLKCEWAIKETDWLGYWLTPTGIKPWNKKIQPILALKEPKNKHELRSFIGMVTHYKDMWKNRAHILSPLTDLTKNVQYIWEKKHQKAFEDIKSVISTDVLLTYPDHNKPFDIHTDASNFQIASEISQDYKPIAYFSRKLNETQKNYTTEEQELLAIVETLKEYRSMLLGAEINIYTDHDNLTYEKFRSQRVLRWRLYIEEFSPKIQHIPGKLNKVADALSRLPTNEKLFEEQDNTTIADLFYDEIFLNDIPQYPINFNIIQQEQEKDREIQELIQQNCPYIHQKDYSGIQLWTTNFDNPNDIEEAKIMIPRQMLTSIVSWYHQILMHAGRNKVEATIKIHFTHPQLHNTVMNIINNCEACQIQKRGSNRGYGQLIPRKVDMTIWDTIAVDTIGPWTVTINDQEYNFRALTIIDINSNLAEIVRIDNPSAPHVSIKFQNTWLARYPRPTKCIHDNGGEFGPEFQQMLRINGIQSVPTTIKNPQSNAICERMHSTIENMIRTRLHNIHINQTPNDFIDTILADATFALRASIHQTMQTTPSIIAFHRDMLLNIPTFVDLANIQYLRQQQVNKDTERQNMNRNKHQYQINQQVLITPSTTTHRKLNPKYTGPYTITEVHQNNTVTIQRRNNITETINIRRIKPFRTE
jgi:Reverse transcriptase (RNA-dependent DNA polymerase)./Integrase core domain.